MESPAQFRDSIRIRNRVRSYCFIPGDRCFRQGAWADVLLFRNGWGHDNTGLRVSAGCSNRPGLPTGIAATNCKAIFVPYAARATFNERSGSDAIRPEA